jgi:hypothetical protein
MSQAPSPQVSMQRCAASVASDDQNVQLEALQVRMHLCRMSHTTSHADHRLTWSPASQDEWEAIAAAGGLQHVPVERLQHALAMLLSTIAALPACEEHIRPISKLVCMVRQ